MIAEPKPDSALNLRLPSALHKRLTRAAAASHRSLNAEILARLNDSLVSKWSEVGGQTVEMKDLARLVAQHDEVLKDLKQRINKAARDDWTHMDTPRKKPCQIR